MSESMNLILKKCQHLKTIGPALFPTKVEEHRNKTSNPVYIDDDPDEDRAMLIFNCKFR